MDKCTYNSKCNTYIYAESPGVCTLSTASILNWKDRQEFLYQDDDYNQWFKLPVYNGSSVDFTIDWSKVQPAKKYAVTCFDEDGGIAGVFINLTFQRDKDEAPSTTSGGTSQKELDDIKARNEELKKQLEAAETKSELDAIRRENELLRKQLENSKIERKLDQIALGGGMIILL